jgi:hypothetical protein
MIFTNETLPTLELLIIFFLIIVILTIDNDLIKIESVVSLSTLVEHKGTFRQLRRKVRFSV